MFRDIITNSKNSHLEMETPPLHKTDRESTKAWNKSNWREKQGQRHLQKSEHQEMRKVLRAMYNESQHLDHICKYHTDCPAKQPSLSKKTEQDKRLVKD